MLGTQQAKDKLDLYFKEVVLIRDIVCLLNLTSIYSRVISQIQLSQFDTQYFFGNPKVPLAMQ